MMQINYAELKNRSCLLQSLTGFSATQLEALLLPSFEAAWESFAEDAFEHENRQRDRGGGRQATLKLLADKLLFILFYCRQYLT